MSLGKSFLRRVFVLAVLMAGIGVAAVATGQDKKPEKGAPKTLSLEESLKKARVNGKYAMLLRQMKVDEDKEEYGDFREAGLQRFRRYKGHNDVPAGYWVYVYPYWYIWRDLSAVVAPRRTWGPEQATGAPDTPDSGDFGSAWASLTPDAQNEWLLVEFAEPVVPSAIQIHESWNPGAVIRVLGFKLDGKEVELWNGDDPTSTDKPRGVSEIKVKADYKISRLIIHLDSREVRGWNEIDAVGLVDKDGKTQWATSAEASSTAATGPEQAMLQALILSQQRIRNLEEEIVLLKKAIEEMKKSKQ